MRSFTAGLIGMACVLCGEGSLQAAIVYRDFPDIVLNTAGGQTDIGFDVDLNGVDDLRFYASSDCPAGCGISIGMLNGSTIGLSIPFEFGYRYADRLVAGTIVDATADYVGTWGSLIRVFGPGGGISGPWNQSAEPAFIPFTLLIDGNTHFGWMRARGVSAPVTYPNSTIFDIAYEDVPNTPIAAGAVPAPGTAALAGIAVLCAAHRRRTTRR